MGTVTVPASVIDELLNSALREDLGDRGDITSQAIFSADALGRAIIKSKEAGVLAGINLINPLFEKIDKRIVVQPQLFDGAALQPGSIICRLTGPVIGLLSGERIALNFLQHLSGIATAAHRLSALIAHTRARLLDTRKTTPGLRLLEKQAVTAGGGCNHRIGLYDMILIKDTHVKAAGGVTAALAAAQKNARALSVVPAIEVEVQSREEFSQALSLQPDRIMLDNMSIPDMAWCVAQRNTANAPQAVELEASGNVSAATIAAIAETGVDFISCGAITHSVKALDIHMVMVDNF